MTIQVELRPLNCAVCGCVYGVSEWWIQVAVAEGNEVCCPVGHKNHYGLAKPKVDAEAIQRDNERLRRELAQAIHDADQKAAAMEAGKEPADGPALQPEPPRPSGPHCPTCGKPFKKWGTPLRRHLEREHGATRDQAREAIGRGMFPGAFATTGRDMDDVPDAE